LEGECIEYYPIVGRLRQVRNYRGGLLEGEIKSYYKTGEIEWLGQMKMNNPVGYWKHYNKEGIVVEERQADTQLLREMSKEI
jgi:antitoxin component YwqK of YwqJK toxin-antitoxin module